MSNLDTHSKEILKLDENIPLVPKEIAYRSSTFLSISFSSLPLIFFLLLLFSLQAFPLFFLSNQNEVTALGLAFFTINTFGYGLAFGIANTLDIFVVNFYGAKEQNIHINRYFSLCLLFILMNVTISLLIASYLVPSFANYVISLDPAVILQSKTLTLTLIPGVIFNVISLVQIKKFAFISQNSLPCLLISLVGLSLYFPVSYLPDVLTLSTYMYLKTVIDFLLFILLALLSLYFDEIEISLLNVKIFKYKRLLEFFLISFTSVVHHTIQQASLELIIFVNSAYLIDNIRLVALMNVFLAVVKGSAFNAMGTIYAALVNKNAKNSFELSVSLVVTNLILYLLATAVIYTYKQQFATFCEVNYYFIASLLVISVNIITQGIVRGIGKDNLIIPPLVICSFFINIPLGLTYSVLLDEQNEGVWSGFFMSNCLAGLSFIIIAASLEFEDLSERMNARYKKILSKIK